MDPADARAVAWDEREPRRVFRSPYRESSTQSFATPMTDIWNGDISFEDGTVIEDITLASHHVASTLLPTTSLRFLATVDTARVPLYLATGPSFDVWTTSEDTQDWFSSILLSKPVATEAEPATQWWSHAQAQSPIGILAKVESDDSSTTGLSATEILFYGTIAAPVNGALPTPPSSSAQSHVSSLELPELKVYALPLSSNLSYNETSSDVPPSSPTLDASEPSLNDNAQFLPPTFTTSHTPSSPKRKRDIFDEASQARKQARRKGGEGIAAAAARGQESQQTTAHRNSLSIDTKQISKSEYRPTSAHALSRPPSANALSRPLSRPLSRSPSVSSDTRPLSRKGVPESQSKRSALSQVATQSEEQTTESRNKEALSRVVMAAMRMHGLQQRKKNKTPRTSLAAGEQLQQQQQQAEETAIEDAAKDEEYKLIYHQTYKSAVLAFRNHIATKPLHMQPDRLRDVAERLLAVFCTDPLTVPLQDEHADDPLATPAREGHHGRLSVPISTHGRASPFDLPSAGRRLDGRERDGNVNGNGGSPVAVRRPRREGEIVPG